MGKKKAKQPWYRQATLRKKSTREKPSATKKRKPAAKKPKPAAKKRKPARRPKRQAKRPEPAIAKLARAAFQNACRAWPDMPMQLTFLGWKEAFTQFVLFWNGSLGVPTASDLHAGRWWVSSTSDRKVLRPFDRDSLHLSFGFGEKPVFPGRTRDDGNIQQSRKNGYFPVVETYLNVGPFLVRETCFVTIFAGSHVRTGTEPLVAFIRYEAVNKSQKEVRFHLWAQISSFHTRLSMEAGENVQVAEPAPAYGRELKLEEGEIRDDLGRVRLIPSGAGMEFFPDASDKFGKLSGTGLDKNLLHFSADVAPGKSASFDLKVPYFPAAGRDAELFRRTPPEEALRMCARFWAKEFARGPKVLTPEKHFDNIFRAFTHDAMICLSRDPITGELMPRTSPFHYGGVWSTANCQYLRALDLRGFHDEVEQCLSAFFNHQGQNPPPGDAFGSSEGFLCSPADWCPFPYKWVSDHGSILRLAGTHYFLTRRDEWLKGVADNLVRGCEWTVRECSRMRVTLRDGTRPHNYGLLPPGRATDDSASGHHVWSDAAACAGMKTAAAALVAVGDRRGEKFLREAERYRADIERAWREASRKETFPLKGGGEMPFVPNKLSSTSWKDAKAFDLDGGAMWLLEYGIVGTEDELLTSSVEFFSEKGPFRSAWDEKGGPWQKPCLVHGISSCEPFYAPQARIYFERDDLDRYVEMIYSMAAGGFSRKTLTGVETRYGVWGLPWAGGGFSNYLRWMFLYERGDELLYLWMVPPEWLQDGKEITFEDCLTDFGLASVRVHSHVSEDLISVELILPGRNLPTRALLRLRHPAGEKLHAVRLDGEEWTAFVADSGVITLPSEPGKHVLVAAYSEEAAKAAAPPPPPPPPPTPDDVETVAETLRPPRT